jgi:ribosomal-protein-alanine N-acetyltransferase
MVNDPEVRRFLPAGPAATPADFPQIVAARQAMEAEQGLALWAVDDKATGTLLGQCGLRPVHEGDETEVELAYHYTRSSWGQGYGTEAAAAVLSHGFALGLDTIMAVVMAENIGSWRIMEKAGMRYEGLVDYFGLDGLKQYVAGRDWWSPRATG